MLSAVSKLLPLAAHVTRQVVPAVVATLIAAGLIAGYNRAFSGHLQQPRMAALHAAADDDAPATIVSVAKPAAPAPIATYDNIAPPPRLWEKEAWQDAGKDQTTVKIAAEPMPALERAAQVLHAEPKTQPRTEPKVEQKTEPRHVASVEPAQPIVRVPAPAPVIVAVPPSVVAPPNAAPVVSAMPPVQEQRAPAYPVPAPQPQYAQPSTQQPPLQPPPVITAQPLVTVPDKPRPIEEAQAESTAPQRGVFGKMVDTLKPSNLFARAREFGEKIEAAGNDLLPNIRQ
jgi:hypothetical protein